jgi:hypothetical protein
MVMALWFCEIKAREMAQPRYSRNAPYEESILITIREKAKRIVINIDELLAEKDKTVHLGEPSAYNQRGNR